MANAHAVADAITNGEWNKAIGEVVKTLSDMARDNGPQAVDLILATIRAQGIFYIVLGFLFAGATGVFTWLIIRGVADMRYTPELSECRRQSKENIGFARVIIGAVGCFIFGIAALLNLLQISNWLAAIDPRLAIAWKAVSKFF